MSEADPSSPSGGEKTLHVTVLDEKENVILEADLPAKWSSTALKSLIQDSSRVPSLCQQLSYDGGVVTEGDNVERIYTNGRSARDNAYTLLMRKYFGELQ